MPRRNTHDCADLMKFFLRFSIVAVVGSASHVVAVQSSGDVFQFSSTQQTWVQCKKPVPQGGAWKAAIGADGELWYVEQYELIKWIVENYCLQCSKEIWGLEYSVPLATTAGTGTLVSTYRLVLPVFIFFIMAFL